MATRTQSHSRLESAGAWIAASTLEAFIDGTFAGAKKGALSARPSVKRALDQAWNAKDASQAQRLLENLARSLENEHPGAAASLREGLEDTLTLLRLGVRETLWRSLRSTNAIESVNDKIASYARRVKHWRGGKMILRSVGAAVLDAQTGFRRVKGHREMGTLVEALRRHEENLHAESVAA